MKRTGILCITALLFCALCIPAASAAGKVYKISHNQPPSHPIHVAMTQFKTNVEKRTNGAITVDVYHSGTLADDAVARDQVALGTIQGALIMSAPGNLVVGTKNGLGYIEELPFLFPDAATARGAYDGALGEAFAKLCEEHGLIALNYWENGFRNMTNNTRPIVKPEDMQGIKFRIANSEIRQLTFDTLKAPAIPMAFAELFTGLQQGTVNGQENPLSVIILGKFYEVQKYLSMSRHIYNTATFLVNPAFFDGLSKEQQGVIREEADLARDLMRKLNDEVEKTAIDDLKAKGMQVNDIDSEAFKQAVQPVWDFFREKYGKELIDMALSAK